MEVSLPAFTIGVAFKLMFVGTLTTGQGDGGVADVKVKTIVPIAPVGGTYVALSVCGFGSK